jgi:hypothetical protein
VQLPWPSAAPKLPKTHGEQADAPAATLEKVPFGQLAQVLLPLTEKLPMAQAWQSWDPAAETRPAVQLEHDAAFLRLNLPAGHCVQDCRPPKEAKPASQSEHTERNKQ